MSRDLDYPINILLEKIYERKQGADRDLCEIYLRSACQKPLFAEKRLRSLNRKTANYKQKYAVKQYDTFTLTTLPSTLGIEMDFDHCILSLRSSIEHLAQLINAIVPLTLSPKVTKGEAHVTLKNVIEEIKKNDLSKNDKSLSNLSLYLSGEIAKDWYKELHELRITMFHDKFDRLPRTSLETLEHQLLDLSFLLPNGTARSLKTEQERNIVSYCKSVISEVESVLKESFDALSKYLSK